MGNYMHRLLLGLAGRSALSMLMPVVIAAAVAAVAAVAWTILQDARRAGALEAAAHRNAVTQQITLESVRRANAERDAGNAELAKIDAETADRIAAIQAAHAQAVAERDAAQATAARAMALVDAADSDGAGQCPPVEDAECALDALLPPLP